MANMNREIIAPNLTINPNDRGEISTLATDLQREAPGVYTRREAIERARAILARQSHAATCVTRAIALAIAAPTQADADRYTESAIRFLRAVKVAA